MTVQKRRLGRGLAALIGDDAADDGSVEAGGALRQLPIDQIRPNPFNPRRRFATEELDELVQSIRDRGVLQPLIVRPRSDGDYEIVAGERRWRAAQAVPIHDVPVLVRELSDAETLEIALIENIQRADLNPLEEAQGYSRLIDQFGYTQQELGDSVGKSRSHIANALRLLSLPDEVKAHIERGDLTAGHARTLVTSDTPGELARQIIAGGLSVREAERLAQGQQKTHKAKRVREPSPDARDLERRLSEALGLRIEISERGGGRGSVVVHYRTLEQLDELSRRLTRE